MPDGFAINKTETANKIVFICLGDAVFAEGDRFEVVDWKTGGTASIDPRQLAIYRLAWAQIAGVSWRDVDAAFVMVATGDEIRPDTDAEVESLLALD